MAGGSPNKLCLWQLAAAGFLKGGKGIKDWKLYMLVLLQVLKHKDTCSNLF
jgi:hypothetical protein